MGSPTELTFKLSSSQIFLGLDYRPGLQFKEVKNNNWIAILKERIMSFEGKILKWVLGKFSE